VPERPDITRRTAKGGYPDRTWLIRRTKAIAKAGTF